MTKTYAFNGENNIKSGMYYAEEALKHTNNCCIRVCNKHNENFINIPLNFKTEDEAIDYIRDNNLENKYCHGEIITENDLVLSKW
jgi:hypothetical protein